MEYLSFSHSGHHYAVPLTRVRYIAADQALDVTRVSDGTRSADTVDFEGQSCIVLSLSGLINKASEQQQLDALHQLLANAREQHKLNSHHRLPGVHDCSLSQWLAQDDKDAEVKALKQRIREPHESLHQLMTAAHPSDARLHELATRLDGLLEDGQTLLANRIRPTIVILQPEGDPAPTPVGLKVEHIGEVFSADALTGTSGTSDFLPEYAIGWLKDIPLQDKAETILVLNPDRIRQMLAPLESLLQDDTGQVA